MSLELANRVKKILTIDVAVKVGNFLLLPVYLNIMTKAEYGAFGYIISIASMLGFMMSMGQNSVLSRFYHTNEFCRNTVIESIHVVLFLSYIFFISLCVFFQDILMNKLFVSVEITTLMFYLILFLGVLFSLNQILTQYLFHSEKINLIQKKNILTFLFVNIIALGALHFIEFDNVQTRFFALIIANILILKFFYKWLFRRRHIKLSNISISFIKRAVKNGLPLSIGSLVGFLIGFGDQFVIEKILSTDELGLYTFGLAIAGFSFMVSQTVNNIWQPFIFKEKNLNQSFKLAYKVSLIHLVLSFIMAGGTYVLVYVLTEYFIDSSYRGVLDFIWLLLISNLFLASGSMFAYFYQIFEKNSINVTVASIAAMLNITLNYLFIPEFGLWGAAVSTLITMVSTTIVGIFIVHYLKNNGDYGDYQCT